MLTKQANHSWGACFACKRTTAFRFGAEHFSESLSVCKTANGVGVTAGQWRLLSSAASDGVLQLFILWAKVTARALGQTMSTLVVQVRHLWLTLADMRESDKHRFLDSPISQAGLFGEAVEDFAQQFSAAQKQTEAFRHILPWRSADVSTLPLAAAPPSAHRRGHPPTASISAPARPH